MSSRRKSKPNSSCFFPKYDHDVLKRQLRDLFEKAGKTEMHQYEIHPFYYNYPSWSDGHSAWMYCERNGLLSRRDGVIQNTKFNPLTGEKYHEPLKVYLFKLTTAVTNAV